MRVFLSQLYEVDKVETKGRLIKFKLFELLIITQSLINLYYWIESIRIFEGMPYPSGIGININITFLLNSEWLLPIGAMVGLSLFLGFFRKGKYWYLLALIGMHLIYSARYSQGKVSHGSHFTGIALLALALAPLIFKKHEEQRKFIFGTTIFLIGLGYMASSFSKLIASGFLWADGEHLISWIYERSVDKFSQNGQFEYNWLQQLILSNKVFATFMLTFGLLTEFSGFLFWFSKSRPIISTFVIAMHIGITFVMNIGFLSYIVIILIIGYPLEKLIDRFDKRLKLKVSATQTE